MNKVIFIFFILLIAIANYAQSFEGIISYKNSYRSKVAHMTGQELSAIMGDVQEYFIQGGNYKSVSNGTVFQWQLYSGKDNKLYSKMSNSDTVLWDDGAVNLDQVIKSEIHKNAIEILGYTCDELILECKTGIYKYYYNVILKLDPKLYEKHKFANWYEFVSRTKALPLKVTVDNAEVYFESVAVEVKPKQLDKSIFELPDGTKTMKATYH